MADCPKCGSEIGRSTFCGCGWKKYGKKDARGREEAPPVACAHVECPRPAIVRMKRSTGWGNFCHFHYMLHHTDDAKDWLADNGLLRRNDESMKDWRARTLRWLANQREVKKGGGMKAIADALPPMREPGEDREEMPA